MRPLTDVTPAYDRKHAERNFCTKLIDIRFSVFKKDRQAKTFRTPYPNFGESRFPESSQILSPVKIFFVFPNPAPYLGQIPDSENTLPNPGRKSSADNI